MNWRVRIPWSMVVARAALGPLILLVAVYIAHPETLFGFIIAAGFLSDVYDGILARRWGSATTALRVADSAADTVFYFGILAAMILRHWPVLRARLILIALLLALEVTRWLFDWTKFRRMASYHSYASKFWGILLATCTIALLCFHSGHWLLTLTLVWGILCDLEGLIMSVLLPVWTRDVKTLRHAWRLRRQLKPVSS